MGATVITGSELQQALDTLNADTGGEWALVEDKLQKTFTFRNFVDAFGFMAKAAIHAEKMNHHPEWSNVYRTVVVNLTTHDAGGITELDFQLARRLDSVA